MLKPFIIGLEGKELTANEIDFIKENMPWGIILFARNIDSPTQVLKLTDKLRDITGRTELPILIDQEGGRVARLKGEGWRSYPAPAFFYDGYMINPDLGLETVRLNAALQAAELRRIGVNVNCSPMIDVRALMAHDIIGDRSFSTHAREVAEYGHAVVQGLTSQGVLPVIKHIPGHGRALCDSHFELPKISCQIHDLKDDFYPFRELNYAPLAMTAHILYDALDDKNCATLSAPIIRHVIRGMIGFTGLLMTDDMSMKALAGNLGDLSVKALDAGCDLILHCNGQFDEMVTIANALDFDTQFLELRTEKIFSDLHFQKSPQLEADLLQEYQESMMQITMMLTQNKKGIA